MVMNTTIVVDRKLLSQQTLQKFDFRYRFLKNSNGNINSRKPESLYFPTHDDDVASRMVQSIIPMKAVFIEYFLMANFPNLVYSASDV